MDAPGGGGKIPVAPNYVISQAKNLFVLRNYEGKIYSYREEPETAPLTFNELYALTSRKKKKAKIPEPSSNIGGEQQLELFDSSDSTD